MFLLSFRIAVSVVPFPIIIARNPALDLHVDIRSIYRSTTH